MQFYRSEWISPPDDTVRRERDNLAARILFTTFFVIMLAIITGSNQGGKKIDFLPKDQCLQDLTFEWLSVANQYLLENLVLRNWVIMFNSMWLDVTVCLFLFLFKADKLPSLTFALALVITALTKTLTQQSLLTLGRQAGFNYYFPGFYATIVPYHDVLDFFYSGHMATAAIIICTLHSLVKHHPGVALFYWLMWLWQTFKLAYIWVYMTALRTHYVIDFASGLCMGYLCYRLAEKLSYFIDVKLCGRPADKRGLWIYKPCVVCGWSNRTALDFIDDREKHLQAWVSDQDAYRNYQDRAKSS